MNEFENKHATKIQDFDWVGDDSFRGENETHITLK